MRLTSNERDQLRQRFLNDVEVNLDRLIVLTEQTLAKKFEEEIKKVKYKISNLIKEINTNKEIEDLIDKTLLSDNK